MKTLFVVSERRVNQHVGEEYDEILEVEHQPTTDTILDWGNRLKDRIRALWHEQVKEGTSDMKVAVYLDAASPFNGMLLNLRIIMKAEEGIVIDLPYMTKEMWDRVENGAIEDPEAKELLSRMDRK